MNTQILIVLIEEQQKIVKAKLAQEVEHSRDEGPLEGRLYELAKLKHTILKDVLDGFKINTADSSLDHDDHELLIELCNTRERRCKKPASKEKWIKLAIELSSYL